MKKSVCTYVIVLCTFICSLLNAQTTVLLTADYDVALGYHDNYNTANTNYWNALQNAAYVLPGTHSLGGLNVNRALIHFDLSVIPAGAIVTSARINLYAIGPPVYSVGHTGNNNSSYLQRVIQPWSAATATWNNQPLATSNNQVTLPQSTAPLQDYTNINVLPLVLDMLATNNHGFLLRLVNETLTNGLMFASIDCGNPAKFPTLEVTYILNLPSPPIHCLDVDTNGDVTLTWRSADQSILPFSSYHLWTSQSSSGPFIKFDSIYNPSTLSIKHWGAGALNQPAYYYLTVQYAALGNPVSTPFDTVSTMFLQVNNTGLPTGVATLSWNPTRSPLLPSSTGRYKVWREHPSGFLQMVGTTTGCHFIDSIIVCHDSIHYRVEIEDTLNTNGIPGLSFCLSGSNRDADMFEELTPPSPPVLSVVSIDTTTQQGYLSWQIGSDPDTDGYIVFIWQNNMYSALDTVYGKHNASYSDHQSQPCSNPVTYALAAFDSCGNISSMSQHHNTLLPQLIQTNCVPEITINWNPYINFQPSLWGYELFVSVDGSPMTSVGNTPPGIHSYTHHNLVMGSVYCYQVKAFDALQQYSSESCIACHLVSMPLPIDSVYIKTATVESNRDVRIKLHNDPNLPASFYNLYRSENGTNFILLDSIPWESIPSIEYLDQSVNVHARPYYYRAEIIDLCGDAVAVTNTVRTILLEAEANQRNGIINVHWNDYEGFDGFPSTYFLWRKTDNIPELMPLLIGPPLTGAFSDDVSVLAESGGVFSYQIECQEGPGNVWGIQEKSFSNEITVEMEPRIYIPSAFTPDGSVPANIIFKPFGRYMYQNIYEFQVFNRFGQLIFTTTDPAEGWDGTYQGTKVSEGVYVWRLIMGSITGKLMNKTGTVMLIR
jgi:gliding motility-associated-like protein